MQRQLEALDYPAAGKFDEYSNRDRRELVLWLESDVFRVLSEREREVLFSDGDGWVDAFLKLLQKLKCRRPYGRLMNEEQTLSALQWLVAEALSVRYAEDGEYFNEIVGKMIRQKAVQNQLRSSNACAKLMLSPAPGSRDGLEEGIGKLCDTLGLPPHDDHEEVLQTICAIARGGLGEVAMDTDNNNQSSCTDIHAAIRQYPLGFRISDDTVAAVAKVLRMLHIRDLRDLQTEINNLIAAAQELTAEPQTDSGLGKVGK